MIQGVPPNLAHYRSRLRAICEDCFSARPARRGVRSDECGRESIIEFIDAIIEASLAESIAQAVDHSVMEVFGNTGCRIRGGFLGIVATSITLACARRA